jgi:hypothetical protein
MKKIPLLLVLASLAIAFFVCGQPALAQNNSQSKVPFQIKVMPPRPPEAYPEISIETATPANLYGLSQTFTAPSPSNNSDGSPIWPCFGSNSTNPDCPTIGNPMITFPSGGVAVGSPAYSWSLANCNQTTTSSPACGGTETFYEDDTPATTTDDLLYTLTATQIQGSVVKYILDTGTIDFLTNPFGGNSPPAVIVVSGNTGFGTMGITGVNNGNCSGDVNYPSASDPNTSLFVIAANKTCVAPISGLVTLTATTEIATPHYTKQTLASKCLGVGPPCWTVTYTKKFLVSQKWNIFLN